MVPRKVVSHIVFYHVKFVEYKGTKMCLIESFLKPCTIERLSSNPYFFISLVTNVQTYACMEIYLNKKCKKKENAKRIYILFYF